MPGQHTNSQDALIVLMPQSEHDIESVHRYLERKGYTMQILETVDLSQPMPLLGEADICMIDIDVRVDDQPVYRWLAEHISGDLIGLCERARYERAARAVEQGVLYDYVIIKPLYDIHQVGFALQRALKQQESDRAIQMLLQELEQFRHEILAEQLDTTHAGLRETLDHHLEDLRQGLLSQQRDTIAVKNRAQFDALFRDFQQQVPESLGEAKDKLYGELFMPLESTQEAFQTQMEDRPLFQEDDGPTVLLVDDQASVVKNISRMLQVHGYGVLTAENGEQGILQAREHNPAVILMDIAMPGLTGIEAVRVLKKEADTAAIPIIMMTSYSTEDFVDQAREAGADKFIAKPFRTAMLVERIQQAIRRESLS
ncbi:MAG TPA: response regulator [bacterium]|nr:response regulator [bacterium]